MHAITDCITYHFNRSSPINTKIIYPKFELSYLSHSINSIEIISAPHRLKYKTPCVRFHWKMFSYKLCDPLRVSTYLQCLNILNFDRLTIDRFIRFSQFHYYIDNYISNEASKLFKFLGIINATLNSNENISWKPKPPVCVDPSFCFRGNFTVYTPSSRHCNSVFKKS